MAKPKSRAKFSRRRRARRNEPRRLPWRRLLVWCGALTGVAVVAVALYAVYLDVVIRHEFEGKRWALPARVHARALELYAGAPLTAEQFERELRLLGYRSRLDGGRSGSYERRGQQFRVMTRPFRYWDGNEPARNLVVTFQDRTVARLEEGTGGGPVSLARLDPFQFASIFPRHNEDRILVRLEQVPQALRASLIAMEDKRFYQHAGVDVRGLGRAMVANVRAGRVVQGGSTLTQQLVKNFFLTRERTWGRKAKEALMALLLERHYTKDEIFQAYCNEVYLGQDGPRAIHGFGLGARFYFGADLQELELQDLALLVALVKGPSYYDPWRHPERALKRRNQVLDALAAEGHVDGTRVRRARQAPLGIIPRRQGRALSRFPAFVQVVREQLRRDYKEEDLRSEGLQIFTTLDPQAQFAAEDALADSLRRLEKDRGLAKGQLEGAVVVTDSTSGEVLAAVGGRDPSFAGFNRALHARRPVGSIIKPAVYLTALAQAPRFHLASVLDDSPLQLLGSNGRTWSPDNFDRTFHGPVSLQDALVNSYNVATVRLGMDVGVDEVRETLYRMGVRRPVDPYPSLFLGAVELSPWEVAQMYQTLAGGGFYTPLRAIRSVLDPHGEPLQRYPLEVTEAVDPVAVFQVNTALQQVVARGTARGLSAYLPEAVAAAGKTGTTDDLRDSWFAGFTGDKLAAVWLGRDDNGPAGLSGSGGAMHVWGSLMADLRPQPLMLAEPDNMEWVWIDPATQTRAAEHCSGAIRLPFTRGTAPGQLSPCAGGGTMQRTFDWLKGLF